MIEEMQPANAADAVDLTRRNGGRATPQRIAILQAVIDSSDHRTAQQIHLACEQRGVRMQLSTVYRVLTTFEHDGLVHAVPTPAGMTYGARTDHHIHAVCLGCSATIDVSAAIQEPIVTNTPYSTPHSNILVTGLCDDCRSAAST